MTDSELKTALALALEWKRLPDYPDGEGGWLNPQGEFAAINDSWLPDYPNDLNACHKAAMALGQNQRDAYRKELGLVLFKEMGCHPSVAMLFAIDAKPRYRAEALLRTLTGEQP